MEPTDAKLTGEPVYWCRQNEASANNGEESKDIDIGTKTAFFFFFYFYVSSTTVRRAPGQSKGPLDYLSASRGVFQQELRVYMYPRMEKKGKRMSQWKKNKTDRQKEPTIQNRTLT